MDPNLTDVVTVVVLGYMGVRLASGARYSRSFAGRALVGEIVRGIRWRHVWPVPLVLAGVLAVATPLLMLPVLDWGWWQAVGGEGNPVFGSSSTTAGSPLEWIIPLAFMCLLIPALPLFAHAEERLCRSGAERWSWARRVSKVLQFGLMHALIGIPIGVALALSVGGAYFMAVYLAAWRRTFSEREATMESTRAHTAYNGAIIFLVLVVVIVDALL